MWQDLKSALSLNGDARKVDLGWRAGLSDFWELSWLELKADTYSLGLGVQVILKRYDTWQDFTARGWQEFIAGEQRLSLGVRACAGQSASMAGQSDFCLKSGGAARSHLPEQAPHPHNPWSRRPK